MNVLLRPLAGLLACTVLLSLPVPATADAADIRIIAPRDGARLSHLENVVLNYTAHPSARDDYLHIYVDYGRATIVRALPGEYALERVSAITVRRLAGIIHTMTGRYTIGRLSPGYHVVTLEMVDSHNRPVGVSASVAVVVE